MSTKTLLLLGLIIGGTSHAWGQQDSTKKLLIVGNRYAYFNNNFGEVLQNMFYDRGVKITIHEVDVPMGLRWFIGFPKCDTFDRVKKQKVIFNDPFLDESTFDYVLMQENYHWILIPELLEMSKKYFVDISDFFKKKSSSQIFIFQNQPITNYPDMHCYPHPSGKEAVCSEEIVDEAQEMRMVKNATNSIAKITDGTVIPYGEAIVLAKNSLDESITKGDDSIPLKSYIMASLIFNAVSGGKKITQNDAYFGLSLGDRVIVESICARVGAK